MFKHSPEKWPDMKPHEIAKHREQRANEGMSWYDWINFDQFLAQIIVNACDRFLVDGHGFPASLNNMSEWKAILREMRDGFQAHLEISDFNFKGREEHDALQAKYKRAMELFAIYHPNMWD